MGTSNANITEEDQATIETKMDGEDEVVDSPQPSDSSPYLEGEKVLAYHNLCVYEARVQKVDLCMNEWKFHVHYLGWNKNWDEWVGTDRLMKHTEENVEQYLVPYKKQGMEKTTKPEHALSIQPKIHAVARGKKRKNDYVIKEKGTSPIDMHVKIHLPPTLKKQLVDDCEFITHLGKLVKLPRSPSIDDILKKYRDCELKKDGKIADSVKEILRGLRCYFDKALPAMLLYKSERQQYQEAISDNVSPSTVYGAEHLLRLFVKLPEILYHANIEEATLTALQLKLMDFLKFLQKNQNAFFLPTYQRQEESDAGIRKQDD